MAALPNSPLKLRTRCRLCTFGFDAEPYTLSGNPVDAARLVKLSRAATKHYEEKHPDIISAAVFSGWNSQDPELARINEAARAQLAALTRKNTATNDQILDRCAKIGLNEAEIAKVSPLLFEMRDYLTEQGKHAPKPVTT